MCGRFALDKSTDELISIFVAEGGDARQWQPRYSIAPTDPTPIIRERKHKDSGEVTRLLDEAIWDFHPAFMKDSKRPNFNARIETLATSGLWKNAFASSRCIVPMTGYFEWAEVEENGKKVKQPHFIHGGSTGGGSTGLLAAAGIYTVRKVGDEWVISTAIVTREARDASGEVHDRMPVFLTTGVFDEWLSPEKLATDAERDAMLDMMREVSSNVASTITTYEVDRRVNNSHTVDPDDAGLIVPV